ncbi:hypothetical protein BH10ACT5_BH10ACT5_06030 [soil metagenome]
MEPTTGLEPVTLVIEGESDHVHVAHDFPANAPFVLSRCGIALDRTAKRDADIVTSEGRDIRRACLAAVQASPACPLCGVLV